MIPVTSCKDKRMALFGLGESGLATSMALMAGGAQVIAFDDAPQACARARQAGIKVEDLHHCNWHQIDALILTPGVPLTHPSPHWTAQLARAAHVEIIGDIELFVRERAHIMAREGLKPTHCPLIAITGTNGKSTTTALIAHLLHQTGHDVAMGGNIGKPVLQLEPVRRGLFHIIECSSYQIDLSPSLQPTIGVLLNVTPDHIDRHGTFEHYAQVKQRLVSASQSAIIALDDPVTCAIAAQLKQEGKSVISVSSRPQTKKADWFLDKTTLYKNTHNTRERIVSLEGIASLRGQHNGQNAAAALAACDILGLDLHHCAAALASFKGLPHRMEEVGREGHVIFINDSKATNAEASAPALASFDRIYWIAGGLAKQGGIEKLKPFFAKIRHAYLIGAAAQDFKQTIGSSMPVTISGTLAQALTQARRDALADKREEEVAVLFSPACASFDQFANYAARGEAFRQLVDNLLIG